MYRIFILISNNSLLKNTFANSIGAFFVAVLGYLLHFTVSRKLPIQQYGIFQSLSSLGAILGVAGSAVTYVMVKHVAVFAGKNDHNQTMAFTSFVANKIRNYSFVFLAVFVLFCPLLARVLHFENWWGLLLIGSSSALLVNSAVYQGTLVGWQKFKLTSWLQVVSQTLKLATGYAVVVFFPFGWAQGFAFLIAGLALYYGMKKYAMNFHSKFVGKPVSSFAIQVNHIAAIFIYSLMIGLIANLDVLAVQMWTKTELAGYYSAYSLLAKIIFWANCTVISASLPIACQDKCQSKIPRNLRVGVYAFISAASIFFIFLYRKWPEKIVEVFFGSAYVRFSGDLWLFGIMAFSLSLLVAESNFAYSRSKFWINGVLLGCVAAMLLGIYLFHDSIRQTALAATAAFVLGYIGALAINWLAVSKKVVKTG